MDVLNAFNQHTLNCATNWAENSKLYAPYFALVNASGMGKSRLIKELLLEKNVGFYICLRKSNSSGYPLDSGVPLKVFDSVTDTAAFLLACLQKLIDYVTKDGNQCLKTFVAQQFNYNTITTFWTDVLARKRHIMKQASRDFYAKEFRDSFDQINNLKQQFQLQEKWTINGLFIIDEARILVEEDYFQNFRIALQLLPRNPHYLSAAIVVDTMSKISHFSPTAHSDPSSRLQDRSTYLFEPFHMLAFVDIYAPADTDGVKVLTEEQILSVGRPLWGSYIAADNFIPADKLVNFAQEKLLGGVSLNSNFIMGAPDAITILGVRCPIEVNPAAKLSEYLSSERMRFLTFISRDRSFCRTEFTSEPILVAASKRITENYGLTHGIMSDSVLTYLTAYVQQGDVEAGYVGELAVRLLLLRASDLLYRNANIRTIVGNIPVNNFIKMLLNEKLRSDVSVVNFMNTKLNNAVINFNHIVKVDFLVTPKYLVTAFQRGYAFVTANNASGADLIIPMYMGSTLKEGDIIDPEEMSYIVVQVKNVVTVSEGQLKKDFLEKVKPAFTEVFSYGKPFVSIYLNVKSEKEISKFHVDEDEEHLAFAASKSMIGSSEYIIKAFNMGDSFNQLVDARFSYIDSILDWKQLRFIHNMVATRYPDCIVELIDEFQKEEQRVLVEKGLDGEVTAEQEYGQNRLKAELKAELKLN